MEGSGLSAAEWRDIANLRRGLDAFAEVAFEARLKYVADALRELVGGSHLLVVVIKTIAPLDGELEGMAPIFSREFGPDLGRRREIRYRWMTQEPDHSRDPILELTAREAGAPRTVRHQSALDPDVWAAAPVRRLLEQHRVEDRLSAIVPLTDDLEVSYIIDRPVGAERFDAHEAKLLLAAVRRLQPMSIRLVWRHGLLHGQRRLDATQLDVLDALLGEGDEGELAAQLGMGRAEFDAAAAQVYDKLVVDGRVELLRTWLRGEPDARLNVEFESVPRDRVVWRVRQAIDFALDEVDLQLSRVAARLGTTAGALQHSLESSDTTFRDLAERARRERAQLLISRPWLSIAEVAHFLGYKQVSSLNRAVKRWTGTTPRQWRADLLQAD